MFCSQRILARCSAYLALLVFAAPVYAQTTSAFPPAKQSQIDTVVRSELKSTGVPSASIAIVLDSRVVYRKAYGYAQISPGRVAGSTMRYGIGSISKEFLATALLMLESEGRLKLDDKVKDYLPKFGAAGEATLRQLLSHTAGIRDYWPQDYVFADMRKAISHGTIAASISRRAHLCAVENDHCRRQRQWRNE
jgi:D-alanyl-D-alanine carboxypeptidase